VVTVRYFAATRAAAGVPQETVAAQTLADLLAAMSARHGAELTRVLAACSYLVDGLAAGDHGKQLTDDAVVDVLPPFAGG
jgi:molybdopterin converting factor small subunit